MKKNIPSPVKRVLVIDQYYAFRSAAYVRIAREWCEENEIPFFEETGQNDETTFIETEER